MQIGEDYIGIAVVYFCHDGKGNVVFNKRGENCRDEQGTWDIGGGGVEFGDNIEDALRKEIKEEYCADILDYEFLGYRDVHRINKGKKTHWVTLDFKVLVDKAQVKNGEPHKFDAVEWFTMDSLPEPLFTQLSVFFEKYKDKI
jgi:8-oxo-dGTP diphosphatase